MDILIRNGLVVDGTGADQYAADVAVGGGRIVQVGDIGVAHATRFIDAAERIVSPGFVDMHSHADFSLPLNPTADSLVHQGITTTVVGQCGASPAPLLDETREQVIEQMASGDTPLPWAAWSTFGSFLRFLSANGIALNVVPLVGHSTVRAGVMGCKAGRPDARQMNRMRTLVGQAMQDGANGLSTGLIYPPGSYASTEELVELTRVVGDHHGLYFSHIRGECSTLLRAIAEAVRIGHAAHAAVQVSHFKAYGKSNWEKAQDGLDLIHEARSRGMDVTADMYPYLAGSLGLVAILPAWAQEGNRKAILERLRDAEARERMRTDMHSAIFLHIDDWRQVVISNSPRRRSFEGRSVGAMAAERDVSPHAWVFDALLETELQLDVVEFGMCEPNRKLAIQQPFMMLCTDGRGLRTDGPLSRGVPHPRNYGAFPRVLGHYVREEEVISLEQAIWRMSGLPAQKLRWHDRGLIKEGYCADLVIFDPATIADRATYDVPHCYPDGISHVIVNGQLVVDDAQHTGMLAGRVLQSRRALQ